MRNKFLYGWLILVSVVSIVGRIKDNIPILGDVSDVINTLSALLTNLVGWFLFFKIIFYIYDLIVKRLKGK